MTPQEMAEAFERARYEQLRGQQWSDLREAERATRAGVALRALEDSGVTTVIDRWRTTAADAEELASVVAQRDAEIARRRAEHDDEIRTLTAANDAVVAQLTAQLAALRTKLDDALDRARDAEQRSTAAATVIAAVRSALTDAAASEDAGAQGIPAVGDGPVAPISTGVPTQPEQPVSPPSTQAVPRPAQAQAKNRFAKARPVRAGADRG